MLEGLGAALKRRLMLDPPIQTALQSADSTVRTDGGLVAMEPSARSAGESFGRTPARFEAPWSGTDEQYESDRIDGQQVRNAKYRHSTFTNVSFLRANVVGSEFNNCVFEDCYFRDATFTATRFIGCRFVSCTFNGVSVSNADFRYARFLDCSIEYRSLRYSLPTEPNLRMMLSQNLSLQAKNLGQQHDARQYHLDYLSARKEHLLAGLRADNTWYKDHFQTLERLKAGASLCWYFLNAALWRHGESAARLLMSAVALIFAVFPLAFVLIDPAPNTYGNTVLLSLSNFLLLDRLHTDPIRHPVILALSAMEAALGILFAGMYVTVLVKALLRR